MKERVIFDSHCDTIEVALDENSTLYNTDYSFNIPDAMNNLPYIQCLASFVSTDYDVGNCGYIRANSIIDKFYQEYETSNNMYLIKASRDFDEFEKHNKAGIILTLENGASISGSLENLDKLYNRGVRMMTLTWKDKNALGCGSEVQIDCGLTQFGKSCIKKMNDMHMLVDVSHASTKTFFDTLNVTNAPLIASHSCCCGLCNNQRNLTDDQIKQIARSGGVVGVCFYSLFLNNTLLSNCNDIVKHIEYIADLVGVEYVGIGTDFEGISKDKLPCDIKGTKDMNILINKLLERGFSNNEITQIMGENFIKVFKNYIK